jgi:VIT1/CCC1 family predicted Fe2+/Mn2+ transporter
MQKDFWKAFWKSIILNFLAGIIGLLPFLFLDDNWVINWGFALIFIAVVSLLTQLIVGIVYINKPAKKPIGQAMLLSVGFYLLIGLAVCGPVWI